MRRIPGPSLPLAVLAAGSMALAGCGGSSEPAPPATVTVTTTSTATDVTATPDAAESSSSSATDEATSGSPAGLPLTAQTAIEAALVAVPGGTAVAGGRTDEGGQQVWYVEVRDAEGNGTEVYLATATGEVVRQRPVSLSAVASGQTPRLTAQEGITAATEAVGSSRVVEFDLETEKGVTAWYVLLEDSTGLVEVYVNADNGALISQQRDD